MLSDKKVIQIREVMGFFRFLESMGGAYSSLYILGAVLNMVLTGKDRALQLL